MVFFFERNIPVFAYNSIRILMKSYLENTSS